MSTNTSKGRVYSKNAPDECSLLIWNVPRILRRRFRSACFERGITMRQVILNYMKQYANNE